MLKSVGSSGGEIFNLLAPNLVIFLVSSNGNVITRITTSLRCSATAKKKKQHEAGSSGMIGGHLAAIEVEFKAFEKNDGHCIGSHAGHKRDKKGFD